MKSLFSLLLIVVVAALLALIFLGAKPADLLHDPVATVQKTLATLHKTPQNGEAAPAQSPAAEAVAVASATPAKSAELAVAPVAAAPIAAASTPAASVPTTNAATAPNLAPGASGSTVDLTALSANPREWPKNVALKEPVEFPIVFNGRMAGSVRLPAGTTVSLLALRTNQMQVQYQGSTKTIPAKSTDLVERVLAARGTHR